MGLRFPRWSIVLILVWLMVAGTVRRLVLTPTSSSSNDPLLLVRRIVVGLLVLARPVVVRSPSVPG